MMMMMMVMMMMEWIALGCIGVFPHMLGISRDEWMDGRMDGYSVNNRQILTIKDARYREYHQFHEEKRGVQQLAFSVIFGVRG